MAASSSAGSDGEIIVNHEDAMNVDGESAEDDNKSSINEKSRSKRDLILGDLEEELEKQLDEKAIRNELSAKNVKSLLKAVLTHGAVRQYVEFCLDMTDEPPEYQLKMTRAKAKELIDQLPDIAPLLCVPCTPKKKSDINILIEEHLAEDSESDDEYIPPDEMVEDEDESIVTNWDDSSVVSLTSPPPCHDRSAASSPAPASTFESIGLRTRSKFSLSTTPLEVIERAFVPPDITEDMYNPISGDQTWVEFLRGLVQPLDSVPDGVEARFHGNDTIDENDDENDDPEYNVMSDEEYEAPDGEELRNDRNVNISRKELNSLMSEIAEYTQMLEEGYHSDEENGEADEAIDHLINAQPIAEVQDKAPATFPEMRIPSDDDGIVDMENLITCDQYLLMKQQLMQHIQLLLQTYLLSLGNPFVDAGTQEGSKACLVDIKERGDASPGSLMSLPTLASTFTVIRSYERHVSLNEKSLWQWHRDASSSGKKYVRVPVHPHLMKFCLSSCAFPYPLLLPKATFKPTVFPQMQPFSDPIDRLICFALDDCVVNLKMNINTPSGLRVACDVIRSSLLPDRHTDSLMKHVQSKKKSPRPNLIKNYFLGHGPPVVEHYVTPVNLELLCNKDARLIDTSWHSALYEVRDRIRKNASH